MKLFVKIYHNNEVVMKMSGTDIVMYPRIGESMVIEQGRDKTKIRIAAIEHHYSDKTPDRCDIYLFTDGTASRY